MPISELSPKAPQSRWEKIQADREKYQSGDINLAQASLRSAGHLGAVVGDVTGAAFGAVEDAIVPAPIQWAQDAVMQTLGNKFMGSETGQQLVSFLAEHPEAVNDATAAANALELWPASRGPKKALNGLLRQVRTKINNFYGPDPKAKAQGVAEAVEEAVVPAVETAFSPQLQANARVIGTGKNRVREALQTEKGTRTDVAGNMMASGFINQQTPGGGKSLSTMLPFYQANVKGEYNRADTPGITQALTTDYPDAVPPAMAERMWQRTQNNLGRMGRMEKVISGVVDPLRLTSRRKNTRVVVRDKAGPESNLGGEAVGAKGQTSRTLARVHSKAGLEEYAKAKGISVDDIGTQQMLDFVDSAFPFERGPWLGTIQPNLPPTYQKMTPGNAHKAYMNAMSSARQGKKLTENQQQLLATVDNFRANNKPNVNVTPDGMVEFTTSYTSEAKDLGGVGIVMTIDPKNKTTYSMIYDGHDLFGTNPVGGSSLWNVTPIQVRSFGGKADFGSATPQMRDRAARAMQETAEFTGIQPMKGEKDMAYSQRVLSEYQAPVTAKDYANVAENVGMLSTMVTDIQPEEEE